MLLKLIEFIASEQYRTDARNEQSKAVANDMSAAAKLLLECFAQQNPIAKMYDDLKIKLPSNHLGMI